MLEGYDNNWSEWTSENKKSYQNLSEGKYKFKVISKNVYNVESTTSEYTFIIKPPIYRTFYAFVMGIFLLLLLIFSLLKYNSNKLKIEKIKLENIIAQRTEEISIKNKKLEEQKEQIEKQNQKLIQSYEDIQLLSEIGQAITSVITIENIVDTVYFNIKKLIEISTFGIGIYNKNEKILEFINFVDNKNIIPYKSVDIRNIEEKEVRAFIQQKEIINIKDDDENSTLDNEIKSLIYLPLKVENKPIGVIIIKSKIIFYREFHLNIIKNIASYIEIAIDNANAYAQLEKQNIELSNQSEKLVPILNELRISKQIIEDYNEELKKLSIIASKTDNAIMVISKRGEIEWINDGFTKLYGFTYEEFTKKSKSIFVSNTNKNIIRHIKEAILDKKTVIYQVELKDINDKSIWVQTTWTPILDENNNLDKLIAIDSDITKQKEAELQISAQKNKIEKQNFEIMSSLEYARKIQKAILSSENILKSLFTDFFTISKPKNIISGDFYWCRQIKNKKFVAVADCTGHGVPGALMSVLGITFLDEIINNTDYETPNDILFVLRDKLKLALKHNDNGNVTRDGLDIGLFSIDSSNQILYSGAFHSLYILSNAELKILKGSRMPIGFYQFDEEIFELHSYNAKKNDILYLFTDGYSDQFGGKEDKKIKLSIFKELLVVNSLKPLIQQKNNLLKYLENWQGDKPQTDDILIMGIKI